MADSALRRAGPSDAFMREVATLIVNELHLEVAPEDIEPDAPLFTEGLGLDSIDALELSVAISKRYGVELRSDDARNHQIFASLRNLAAHVARQLGDATTPQASDAALADAARPA